MKSYKVLSISIFLLIFCYSFNSKIQAQVSSDPCVLLTATVSSGPPSIYLKWPLCSTATQFRVYKKTTTATTWGTQIANLPGTDTGYVDNNVIQDSVYEYQVIRFSTPTAAGYICSGINKNLPDKKGKLVLIVDSTYMDSLKNELYSLMKDISGDGWEVVRHDVSRFDTVPYIKSLIINDYNADSLNVKAVFLFGHVPVPYSGNINPDGHSNHLGAWPADLYYGDLTGSYTDVSVNNATASRVQNQNVPGDGKFDQSGIPGLVKLQVGRVDLADMPSFTLNEKDLLKRYLMKDHNFRNKLITAIPRALVDDNFGYFSGEAFASSGWRAFSPLLGDNNIHQVDFLTNIQDSSYLWSYGCGGGTYTSASGVCATSDFAADTIQSIFTMLFGSYFGDWDSQDNFLRAPLASSDRALTSCWSGRPYWYFHHMGMGENIGYCAKLSQNDINTYAVNYAAHWVHIALMGDPTLKMFIVSPPSNLILNPNLSSVNLSWSASVAPGLLGYYVYRSNSEFGSYSRISSLVTNNGFSDLNPHNGVNWYQVKAVILETTPSGTFYNTSNAVSDSISMVISNIVLNEPKLKVSLYPNPNKGKFCVQFEDNMEKVKSLILYNMLGQVVFSEKTDINGLINVDISGFPGGVYNCKIITGKNTNNYRIIKE
jgi:hypothetical protein